MKRKLFQQKWVFLFLIGFCVIFALGILGCSEEDEGNDPPVIDSLAVPETVKAGESVTFQANAHDTDGDVLTYSWTVDGTPLSATTPTVTWTAPDDVDVVTVKVSVSDGKNSPVVHMQDVSIQSKTKPPPGDGEPPPKTKDPPLGAYWNVTEHPGKGTTIHAQVGNFAGWYLDFDNGAPVREGGIAKDADCLILSDKLFAGAYWKLTKHPGKGTTIQATAGNFANWYLDFDNNAPTRRDGAYQVSECLVLADKLFAGAYWKLTEHPGKGTTIQATAGNFTNWYLDFDNEAPVEDGITKEAPILSIRAE